MYKYKKLFDRATPNTQHTQARSSALELGAVMMAMMGAPPPPALDGSTLGALGKLWAAPLRIENIRYQSLALERGESGTRGDFGTRGDAGRPTNASSAATLCWSISGLSYVLSSVVAL